MMIYIAIFISKIVENTLATLRIIVVSNGKKTLGAILQGMVALVWILVTGVVIIDVNKDILKIIAFCLGSITGSYLGSLLEEKIALGMVKLTIKTNKYKEIIKSVKEVELVNKNLVLITKRKKVIQLVNNSKFIDKDAKIISERIKIYDK